MEDLEDMIIEELPPTEFELTMERITKLQEPKEEPMMNIPQEFIPYKPSYKELVQQKIATKYSLADEIAILRQIDTKPNEFKEYNDFCEQCKAEAKKETQGEKK